jgi:hypothetical protein
MSIRCKPCANLMQTLRKRGCSWALRLIAFYRECEWEPGSILGEDHTAIGFASVLTNKDVTLSVRDIVGFRAGAWE